MIEIENLTKHFGPVTAVAGLSLTVRQGEVLGFLGPNGAGKSTTMKMVTGYLAPDSGSVRIAGHDIVTDTIAAQRQIGYLPEGAPAYGEMTPRQFLAFIAEIRGFAGAAAQRHATAPSPSPNWPASWTGRSGPCPRAFAGGSAWRRRSCMIPKS